MQQLVSEVLSAWRRAERLAEELDPNDPARDIVSEAAVRLQGIYLDLTADNARARDSAASLVALREGETPA